MLGEQQLPSLITQQLYCCFAGVVTLFVCVCLCVRVGACVCERDADVKAVNYIGNGLMVGRTAFTFMK